MVGRFRGFIYADNIQRCIVSVPGNAGIPVTGYLRRREPRWRIPGHGGRLPYSRAHQVRFAWKDAEICEKVQSPLLSRRKSYFRGDKKGAGELHSERGEELSCYLAALYKIVVRFREIRNLQPQKSNKRAIRGIFSEFFRSASAMGVSSGLTESLPVSISTIQGSNFHGYVGVKDIELHDIKK
ncbi:hypothetical protein WN51_11378 [Melipona quadrifasciata]|uniref:Uncharacterized protein n=1 Tax=Melipona quadrifasciata TaxID=166423 RepID=A0A0N0BJY0_9HYME|nr:hypothetical protein WN51_11378 [Melipona quadrifasciata]